jgi:hypothetical protein
MANNVNIPLATSYTDTVKFLKANADALPNGQFRTRAVLHGFKKVYVEKRERATLADSNRWPFPHRGSSILKKIDVIANLVIPAGTVINLSPSCKLRAEQAYCHSLVENETRKAVGQAESGHDSKFTYRSGKNLGLMDSDFKKLHKDQENVLTGSKRQNLIDCKAKVTNFDYTPNECRAGIHFFLDLRRAINY